MCFGYKKKGIVVVLGEFRGVVVLRSSVWESRVEVSGFFFSFEAIDLRVWKRSVSGMWVLCIVG